MRIAVNARFLLRGQLEGFGHYTQEILRRMASTYRENELQLFFDRPFSPEFRYTGNVHGTVVRPPARHPLLFYLWNQWSLRRALHRYAPDVFFSPDGFMPLNLSCPSVITIHDVAHKPYPNAIGFAQRTYYRYFIPRFLEEAQYVITVSEFSKREILKYYQVDADKIRVVYNGVGENFYPRSTEEQTAVRLQYTSGFPYFLFVGAIHPRKNVARLIEAYTLFRNNNDVRIKLLVAGRKSWDYMDVDRALAKSSFREDIIFTGYVTADTLADITAGAHALCYMSLYEGFGLPVAEAMACGVPVLVSTHSAQAEVAGAAGIQADPMRVEEIAAAMETIMRDEQLRKAHIGLGLERSKAFSWDIAAQQTYTILAEATGKGAR